MIVLDLSKHRLLTSPHSPTQSLLRRDLIRKLRIGISTGKSERSRRQKAEWLRREALGGLIEGIYVGPSDSEDDCAASDSGCHCRLCIFPQYQGTLSAVSSLVWNNIGAAFGSSDSSFAQWSKNEPRKVTASGVVICGCGGDISRLVDSRSDFSSVILLPSSTIPPFSCWRTVDSGQRMRHTCWPELTGLRSGRPPAPRHRRREPVVSHSLQRASCSGGCG
jgi:hypothetical protein